MISLFLFLYIISVFGNGVFIYFSTLYLQNLERTTYKIINFIFLCMWDVFSKTIREENYCTNEFLNLKVIIVDIDLWEYYRKTLVCRS